MSKMTGRAPRFLATAAVAVGVTAFSVMAAPYAALAEPAVAELPTISIGDGTLVDSDSDSSLASVPITYRCEAGAVAAIVVKMRQTYGEYGFVDGVTRHTVPCTGESTTISTTIVSYHGDPWHAGQATGELSIYGQSTATAHQPFAIDLNE